MTANIAHILGDYATADIVVPASSATTTDAATDRSPHPSSLIPHPSDTAFAARAALLSARRWNPAWETNGMMQVFERLGPGEDLDRLVAALRSAPAPVAFGESAPHCDRDDDPDFVGIPSPDSVERHQRALAYMATHPTVNYAQALLRTAR